MYNLMLSIFGNGNGVVTSFSNGQVISENFFLENMGNVYPHFNNMSTLNKLRYMLNMQSNDIHVTDVICSYLKKICIIHEIL